MRIDIESVITRTKVRLGLMDTTLHDSTLELLIQEGARHLDAVDSYVISCTELDVDCNKAKLPEGFSELLCLKLIDPVYEGCVEQPFDPATDPSPSNISQICNGNAYFIPDRNVLTEFCNMGGVGYGYGNVFDTQNGYLVLPDFITVSTVMIWYRGLNVDENGLMVLDDFQERGLSAYAAYQFAYSGQNIKSYDRETVRAWKSEANAQINKIRGKSAQMDHRRHKGRFASIARAFLINSWNAQNPNL